ncbi:MULTISPECIES: tautomerase family protein [Gordonia]|uniref:tautomerase family protein n=1 Tax=Gordonia TaxID=2053 RepID=UPI001EF60BF7|nr:tautomerase family protein [Gordonia sp. McavH-238-E]MCG7631447.1 tautomerase family protein [Gordonia sp. McavH-238-E]
MPYWEIFTPKGAYTDQDKEQFSSAITDVYVQFVSLPRFYVVIRFQELADNEMYVGGKATTNFVRFVVDHIARNMDDDVRPAAMQAFEDALAPFVKDRGFDWEIHFDDTPVTQWHTQGLIPPPADSDIERLWAKENRPIPYDLETLAPL